VSNRETLGKSASSYLLIQHKKAEKVIFTCAMKLQYPTGHILMYVHETNLYTWCSKIQVPCFS